MVELQEKEKRTLGLLLIVQIIAASVFIALLVWGELSYRLSRPNLSIVHTATRTPPPEARPYELAWGKPNAPIQVVEYVNYRSTQSVFQSAEYDPEIVDALAPTGKVHYEIRFLVDAEDETSQRIIRAMLCAKEQNRGWEMHYAIVANRYFENFNYDEIYSEERLFRIAATIGDLDINRFKSCLESKSLKEVKEKYRYIGRGKAQYVAPLFIINGERFKGPLSLADMVSIFEKKAPGVQFLP